MNERIERELELVRRQFGELEHDPAGTWVLLPRFPLPRGWNRSETPLLFFIPSGYPVTPPDNFFVASDLALESGNEPGASTAGQAQLGKSWRVFSWHADPGWRSQADPALGDNLVTFVLKCAERLEDLS